MNIVSYLQPTNLEAEKQRFFSSNLYQPVFEYDWYQTEFANWARTTSRYRCLVQAIMSQDHAQITQAAMDVFQVKLDSEVLEQAREESRRTIPQLPKIGYRDLVHALEQGLKRLSLPYAVEVVDQIGFNIRPEHRKKTLYVSTQANMDMFSVEGVVRHELVHVVRYINGRANQIRRSVDYLATEEGLAVYCHDKGGTEPNGSPIQHAAEYVVTEVMLRGSLRDGYEYLRNLGFSRELSWSRAVRHKFGFIHTALPGDIMKPAMYYEWSRKVAQLTSEERVRLFVGKIILRELEKYSQYEGCGNG